MQKRVFSNRDMTAAQRREGQALLRRLQNQPSTMRLRCPQLGQPLADDLVVIETACGQGKRTFRLQASACAEHGRCLPHYDCAKTAIAETVTEGEWAQPCATCELNPANRS